MTGVRRFPLTASLFLTLITAVPAQAANDVAVHHDGVATAKAAFEQDINDVEQSVLGVQAEANDLTPPNAAPGLPPRPNGCVRSMPKEPKNLLYSVGSGYKTLVSYNRGQCESSYTYQHYSCGSDFQWKETRKSTEHVVTNVQCGGES